MKGLLISSVFLGIFFISCNEISDLTNSIEHNWRPFDSYSLSNQAMNMPGELHNRILDEFSKKHAFGKHKAIPISVFIHDMTESINEAFSGYNEVTRIEEKGVEFILWIYYSLFKNGIYDFFGSTNSTPYDLVDFLNKRGNITQEDADKIKCLLDSFPTMTDQLSESSNDAFSKAEEIGDSWPIFLASDILKHSKEYWSGIAQELQQDFPDKRREMPLRSASTTGCIIADMLGGLVGLEFGGAGAIIGAAVASVLFTEGLEALEDGLECLDENQDWQWEDPGYGYCGENP
jgi:hypothetical protein